MYSDRTGLVHTVIEGTRRGEVLWRQINIPYTKQITLGDGCGKYAGVKELADGSEDNQTSLRADDETQRDREGHI